jgi:type VI secretion system ImpM family protein
MSRFGLVGKIPARDDFVRSGLDGGGLAFDLWLQHAIDAMLEGGHALPDFSLRCLVGFPDEGEAIAALIAPSQDGVGRRHPLAIFERIPLGGVGSAFSALPVATTPFFTAASALAEASVSLPLEEVLARWGALPPTTDASLTSARAICARTLATERAVDFEARAFADPARERCYGYHTVLSAAAPLTGKPPQKPGPLLECPIEVDVDQFAWLELLERVLAWPRASTPGILWCEDPIPRMLVSLGPAPDKALACLVASPPASRLVWPLTTTREEARDEASARLVPALGETTPDATSLGDLIEVLARLAPNYVT